MTAAPTIEEHGSARLLSFLHRPLEQQALSRIVGNILWLVPGLSMMVLLFIIPVLMIFRDSLTDPSFGIQNYLALLDNPLYLRVLENSARAALQTTIGCLIIGYPAAYAIYSARPRWRRAMLGVLLFSFAVGTVPRTFSWLVILGDHGLINRLYFLLSGRQTPIALLYNQVGVIIGMLHVMLPYIVLVLLGSMMRIPPHLVPAARTLGATSRQAFLRILLPLTYPGIFAGAMLVFVYSLGFFLVPAVLGGAAQTTVVMEIESLTMSDGLWSTAASLSSIVIIVSVVGAAIYVRTTRMSDIAQRD